ncbi:hypothetical protein [Streptomyces sp. NPDC005408]|uniref:hypothetical protein n=1 Tax=Streptomyces sp. NPDC005408 TaxID=3155341 RepID=UPI0033AC4E21
MKTTRKITGLVTALAALTAIMLGASPASAESYNGCAWPRVCFYLTLNDWWAGTPTSSFQDVTSYYQNLGSRSRGSDRVYNSRNDDRVWLRYVENSTGQVGYLCLNPNTMGIFESGYTVTGVKIEWDPTCP